MHEKRFNRDIERLRDPERVDRLEVNRVVNLVLQNFKGIHSVLDVGTGSGIFAEAFASESIVVSGLDVNPQMIDTAKEFVPAGSFFEGVAEDLPFPDGKFNMVFMGLLLHETDNSQAALNEAYRVSRRGLAVLEWPYENRLIGPPMEHRISPETIAIQAKEAGFNPINTFSLQNLVLYLFEN